MAELVGIDKDALRMLSEARTKLILNKDLAFFAGPAMRFKWSENAGIAPTAATDGEYMYYNPTWLKQWNRAQLEGLIAHEAAHCMFGHCWRRGNRDPKKWNVACDFAINGILIDCGVTLPTGGCHDAKYRGMSAEEIYGLLTDEEVEAYGGAGGQVLDGPDQGQGDSADAMPLQDQWEMAAQAAAEICRQRGNLPGSLEMLLGQMKQHKVNWRNQLADFVTANVNKEEYNWSSPNKRYLSLGLYMPTMKSEGMPVVACGNDTSGSCYDEQYQVSFQSEMNGILSMAKPEKVCVISGDTRVTDYEEFEPGDEIIFPPKGGGGTDFRPIFEEVEKQGLEPCCMIFFTDSYGTFPEREPDYPVMWVVYGEPCEIPFGEVIRMTLDQ